MATFAKPAGEPPLVENTAAPVIKISGALLPEVIGDEVRISYFDKRRSEVGNPDSPIVRDVCLHVCMTKETFDQIMALYRTLQQQGRDGLEAPGFYLAH